MREYLLIIALAGLGYYSWTLQQNVEQLEEAAGQEQGSGDNAGYVEQIAALKRDLREASEGGLMFKSELDDARAELKSQQEEIMELRERLYRATSPSSNTVTAYPQQDSYPQSSYEPEPVDPQIAVLQRNLKSAQDLLDQVRRRSREYSEHYGASRGGVRTSDADRKRFEDDKRREMERLKNYIATVEAEIRSRR